MKDTIRLHQQYGLTADLFGQVIEAAEYNPGVVETLRAIDRAQYEIVLISGGFRELARRAQLDIRIHHAFAACEYFFNNAGVLTDFNLLPCDFAGKIDFIRLMLREYQLTPQDWIFVGDGLNDIPVAKAAPVSLAYNGATELSAITTFAIDDFRELAEILTAQDAY